MNEQELNKKFSEYERKIINLQNQLSALEQSFFDLDSISNGLEELKDKVGEEILANIGRGIFVKTKLLSEDLLVDVGEGNFANKTIPQAKELISTHQQKLKESQKELDKELEKINEEITKLMNDYNQEMSKQK